MTRASYGGKAKKTRLLEAARTLMLQKGYWGTTLDEICATARASKGSVFHHFNSKEQLAIAALDNFVDGVMEHFVAVASRSTATGVGRVVVLCDAMIELARTQSSANGCLLATLSMETGVRDGVLAERCVHRFAQWSAMLQSQFDLAIREQGCRSCVDGGQLAHLCISIFEGSLILARVRQDVGVVESSLEQFKSYVASLLRDESTSTHNGVPAIGGQEAKNSK